MSKRLRVNPEGIVNTFLDERLRRANEPPGLRPAVVASIGRQADDTLERCRSQIQQLKSASSRRVPDAYFADEETVENELQKCAAGIRSAMALQGVVLDDPRGFEHELGENLAPTAVWSLRYEASLVPRPPTRPSSLAWSLAPIPWAQADVEWPPIVAAADRCYSVGGGGAPALVAERPYVGWVQLAILERQGTLAIGYPPTPARQVLIAAGLEVCDGPAPPRTLPLSVAPPDAWAVPHEKLLPDLGGGTAESTVGSTPGPFVAVVDYSLGTGAPINDGGAGLPLFALVPRLELVASLELRPESRALRHVLVDDNGPALVGRLWRGFLVHDGNYDPLEPGVHGADLLLRPDLYRKLESALGDDRLGLRVSVSHSIEPSDGDGEPEG